jgi:hypothetical protein
MPVPGAGVSPVIAAPRTGYVPLAVRGAGLVKGPMARFGFHARAHG